MNLLEGSEQFHSLFSGAQVPVALTCHSGVSHILE